MYDSVREELALKISPMAKPAKIEMEVAMKEETSKPAVQTPALQNPIPPAPVERKPVQSAPPVFEKVETSEISAKPTSPTLVEFRNQNTTLPEWRLQLQNAVRKRAAGESAETEAVSTQNAAPRRILQTQGATALKAEAAIEENPQSNPKLAAALRRIEQSRQQFYAEERSKFTIVPPPVSKSYPFTVVNTPTDEPGDYSEMPVGAFESKTFPIEPKAEKFDTNKLPPLSEIIEPQDSAENRASNVAVLKSAKNHSVEVKAYSETVLENEEEFDEELDDCAPFGMRFNAGLFDFIIAAFASFILLSPFVILSGNLFSFEGFFAFLATTAIVMFVYLTTSVAFFGRTLGMRLFSLEIIDIEENDYPSFHQAAVNSVVYLFSLALGGLGFLPALFNDERRAAHDLAAGTIVVKEY